MKKFNIVFLILLMTAFGVDRLVAQEEFSRSLGVAAKTSTNGFGGDVVFNFLPKMSVRLGYEKFALAKDFTFKEGTVEYNAAMNYKTGSLSLLFDYYLASHLFVTAGAGWNMFDVMMNGDPTSSMKYGDLQISKEQIGTYGIKVDPSLQISPYFGIGFGRTLGLQKKVGFAFELGGFYQGSPKFELTSTGLLSPTSNPEQQHAARLEKQFDQYNIYPILKLSLSYRIVGF